MNITIFNEYHPDERTGKTEKVYPGGIHETLKTIFGKEHSVTVATQEQAYNGLPDELLDKTDVLIWWSKNWDKEWTRSCLTPLRTRSFPVSGRVWAACFYIRRKTPNRFCG